MKRLAAVLALTGSFLAGAAAMAWWLTRWHDDRQTLTPAHRRLLDGDGW